MPAAHPVAVKLDADVHVRLRQLAKAQHRTPHDLMREAIAQYVEREEKREAVERQPPWPVPTTSLAGGAERKTGMPVWRAAPPA
jgi:hypothetical protein